jgi:chromosome segregation ATPase
VALAEETAARAAEERDRAGGLDERHEALRTRVEELTAELARAEEEAGEVAAELRRAERHRTTAERQARDAATARDRAEERLRDLERNG